MRFQRLPRIAARPVTGRRIAAAKRALQQERDKFPLLTDWVSDQQPTAEARIDLYQDADLARQQVRRNDDAARWKRARTLLRLLPRETQRELLDQWNVSPSPGTSEYFADMVFRVARPLIDSGAITLPDPDLDPRYRLEKIVEEAREQRLQVYYQAMQRGRD